MFSKSLCAFSTLLLVQFPCDVCSDGESFLTCYSFLVSFQRDIISGFDWCKFLQECLDAVNFVVIEEFFEFLCCGIQ
jgi:hypothetical protein